MPLTSENIGNTQNESITHKMTNVSVFQKLPVSSSHQMAKMHPSGSMNTANLTYKQPQARGLALMDFQRNARSAPNHPRPAGNSNNNNNSRNSMQPTGPPGSSGPNSVPPMQGLNIQAELMFLKQEAVQARSAIFALEQEKDSLRKAIRKLKLENSRVRQKMKKFQESVNELKGVPNDAGSDVDLAEQDYDDIGHNFILVGGVQDPLSTSFEVKIKDDQDVEHRSAERLYWYKMAEYFEDDDAKKKVLEAPNADAAENATKNISNFNERNWHEHRLDIWRDVQKMKLDQHREILNLLVLSKGIYIGLASQDKYFGTGWRKNRDEANKPVFWDGENQGGKILMHLRDEYKANHHFENKEEEEAAEKKFSYNRRFVWRRVEQMRRGPGMNVIPPAPLIVRTGLANRRGCFRSNSGMMNYSNPMASFYPPLAQYGQPPQWPNKQRREGANSSN